MKSSGVSGAWWFVVCAVVLFAGSESKAQSNTFDGTVIDTVKWEVSARGWAQASFGQRPSTISSH